MADKLAPRWPALMLVAVGLALSVYLEVVHVQAYLMPSADAVCNIDAQFDCSTVATSRFAVVAGVPLPVWGAAGFLAMGAAAWRRSWLLLPLSGFATLASVGLLVEELAGVGSVCLFCEGVHAVSLLLLVYAVIVRRRLEPKPDRETLIGVFALPAALVVLTWLAAPRYWALTAWQGGVPYAHGVDDDGHPWVGAEEPTVIVHEYVDYGCMHCAVGTARMRSLLSSNADALRVVRRHQPRQHCKKLNGGCSNARAAVCAGEQGKFWEYDSWLFLHAPGKRAKSVDYHAGATVVGIDGTALEACMERDDVYERVESEFRAARKAKVRATPTYVIDGQRYKGAEVYDALDELL